MQRTRPSFFTRLSRATSHVAGRPATFALVIIVVAGWAITGPLFDYSNAWQLTINTLTTIVTFLMVFLIQATQNRDSEAIQIKLDEIIRCLDGADNALLDLEELEEKELVALHADYLRLAQEAHEAIEQGKRRKVSETPPQPYSPRRAARRRSARASAPTRRK